MTDEEFFDLCRGLSLTAVGCAIISLFVYVSLQMVIFGFIAPAMVVVSLILFAMSVPYEDDGKNAITDMTD